MLVITPEKRALYFGWGEGGHFLRGPHRFRTTDPRSDYPDFPWTIDLVDSGLLRNLGVQDRPNGRVHWTCGGTPLWIAFFWWDRSGDKRGGSNSGFYVQGFDPGKYPKGCDPGKYPKGCDPRADEGLQAAFDYACLQWPDVVARQLNPLVLQIEVNI
jgi:hypothetical protein